MIEGHSGCEISERDGVLEKASAGCYPKERLRKQAEKQEIFSKIGFENILIPKIYGKKEHANEFIIEMEHLSCFNIIQYLNRASEKELDELISILFKFIKKNVEKSEIVRIDGSIVSNKFESVKKLVRDKALDDIFRKYYVDELILPIGLCHGDLTLSNILFNQSSNEIVVLDFLDSFIESPIIDIAKIRQDTKHRWSTFIYKKDYDINKIEISLKYLDDRLSSMFKEFFFYKYYKLFQLMNLVRILPYSRDKKTTNYLMKEICSI